MDPQLDLKSEPKNDLQHWAIGTVLKTVNQGANKCLSNVAVIENYEVGHAMVQDYHKILKNSSEQLSKIPAPPRVKLNNHNIIDIQRSLLETYRTENKDPSNPYHQLENCSDFGLLHDATSHWAKQINTIFLRVVSDNGIIYNVPYSMKKVSGGFTGENLCDELATEISCIKKMPDNATRKLPDALKAYKGFVSAKPAQKYKRLHLKLKAAAEATHFDELLSIKSEMEVLVKDHPDLSTCNLESVTLVEEEQTASDDVLPKFPPIFSSANLTGIVDDTILLSIDPANIATTTCGDGFAVNGKGARLLEEIYGIKSPVSKCASHLASGTIRRLCSSVNHSQQDAVNLYDNLRALLKHFVCSAKSTELFNEACDVLEMNNVHILNWGSTRMAGFLDACVQSSHIIVPFLDALVNSKIREDETKFIASPKGVFLLQLFADLHPVFANRYLH